MFPAAAPRRRPRPRASRHRLPAAVLGDPGHDGQYHLSKKKARISETQIMVNGVIRFPGHLLVSFHYPDSKRSPPRRARLDCMVHALRLLVSCKSEAPWPRVAPPPCDAIAAKSPGKMYPPRFQRGSFWPGSCFLLEAGACRARPSVQSDSREVL